MKSDLLDLPPPSVLVVDDEHRIHSSLRLRLEDRCQLVCCTNPLEALAQVGARQFDLCLVDLHMPEMDGMTFIEEARKVDAALGFVIFSGNDSDANLRKAIPLQVLDFVSKPLPERDRLEHRIPDWIEITRARRKNAELTRKSAAIVRDMEVTHLAFDVESLASETARIALLQVANALTTTQALLFSALHAIEPLAKTEPRLKPILRNLQETRRLTESSATLAEGYFSSAYSNRESPVPDLDAGIKDAISISLRQTKAEERRVTVDYSPLSHPTGLAEASVLDLHFMLVPALSQAIEVANDGTTIQVRCTALRRIDEPLEDVRMRRFLWLNRRAALASNVGVLIAIRTTSAALEQDVIESWVAGRSVEGLKGSGRSLAHGIQKARGLVGFAVKPEHGRFEIALALPV